MPSSSVRALAQMTGSLSQGTATSAGKYLHVSQPVCLFLCLNLSSFHCLSSLFSCSLFYSSQHSLSVTHSLMKNNGSAVRNKKGHLFEKGKVSKESRETKCFQCRCANLIFPVVCVLVPTLPEQSSILCTGPIALPKKLPAFNTIETEIQ